MRRKETGRNLASIKNGIYWAAALVAFLTIILSAAALGSMAAAASNTQQPGDGPHVPILVKFKASANSADIDDAIRSSGGQSVRNLAQIRTHVINVPANARDRILTAYSNHRSVERATAAVGLKIAGTPDDPSYPQQWALPRIAWDQAYGNIPISGSAKLAVLDTGVDAVHPDLASR